MVNWPIIDPIVVGTKNDIKSLWARGGVIKPQPSGKAILGSYTWTQRENQSIDRSFRKIVDDSLGAIKRFCAKNGDQSERLVKTAPNLSIIIVGTKEDVQRVFKLTQKHKKTIIIRDLSTAYSENRLTNIEGLQAGLYIDVSVLRVIGNELFSTYDQYLTIGDFKPIEKILLDEIGVKEFKDAMIGSPEGFKINQLTPPKPTKTLPTPQYPGVSFTYPLPGRKRK